MNKLNVLLNFREVRVFTLILLISTAIGILLIRIQDQAHKDSLQAKPTTPKATLR
jgi:hypothetical protein